LSSALARGVDFSTRKGHTGPRGWIMKKEKKVQKNLTLIYWKGKKYWLGKLVENPEIMSQGRTLKELVENVKDAYYQMTLDDVPANYRTLDISV
jgi:hypothetical protein